MQANVWNILDSCAFFTQMHPGGKLATVVDIESEIVNRQSKQYYSNLLNNDLKIIEPSKESIEIVEKKAIKTGDYDVLSSVDLKILALGYELKGTIVSDDFAVQNVCLHMNLDAIGCNGKKIKEIRNWKYKCSACNKIADKKENTCSVCGSEDIFRIKVK